MAIDRSPRRRLSAAVLLVAVIGAGLAVHVVFPDTAATDIAGDVLYAAAVYLAIVVVAPGLRPLGVGAITAAWCTGVELFQLTGIPLWLGAAFPPSMLVLGTVFDARDLLVYVISAAVMSGADVASARRSSQKMELAN
jgi:hypothetical protein